jgi:TRAP-type transport system periplasmic protein
MNLSRCRARSLLLVVACAVSLACAAQPAMVPPVVKLSIAQSPAFPLGRAGERWAQLLNERAVGVEVKLHPGATLSGRDPGREFGALRDGAADLAVGSALVWSTQAPLLAAFALPWLAPEPPARAVLATDPALRAIVERGLDRAGVVLLAVAPLGDRVLATVGDFAQSAADLSGKRVRLPPYPLLIDTFAALGVRGESLGYADALAALAAGALDGQEGRPTTLAATRIGATALKFVTQWRAFSDVMLFAVRRPVWDTWSDEQRTAARATAQAAAAEVNAPEREDAALAGLNQQGVTIVRLSPAQRAAFRAAVESVWAKWTPMIGAEAVAAAQAAVARAPN